MNLSLGFPEFSEERALARHPNLNQVVAQFEAARGGTDGGVRSIHHIPARPPEYAPLPEQVQPGLRGVLEQRGIARLYTHQAESFRLAAGGENVVIVTPTASGKTLCYNLPILNRCLRNRELAPFTCFRPRRWRKTSWTNFTAPGRGDGRRYPRVHL